MLQNRGIRFKETHHPEAETPREAAHREHLGGGRFARVVVAVVDGQPVELVLPATRQVDLGRVQAALCADEVRLATDEEVSRFFTGCDAGTIPPLRGWKGVPVVVDRALRTDGDIVFDVGTRTDAIRLLYRDWYSLVRPFAADLSEPLTPATA
jgi:Ala-tRNA(Pro) deacylase